LVLKGRFLPPIRSFQTFISSGFTGLDSALTGLNPENPVPPVKWIGDEGALNRGVHSAFDRLGPNATLAA
jgi:hypothetical protein